MTEDGIVLDAGAFIALERRDRYVTQLLVDALADGFSLVTSAAVVAQVWRTGARTQTPLASLLHRTNVVALTYDVARTIGRILGASKTRDPIDAHVVLLALERDWAVLTSDPGDLLALSPAVRVESI